MLLAFVLAALTLTGKIPVWHRVRAGRAAGCRERVRHSRAAIVPGGYGGQGRSDERDRAELLNVQRSARDWAGRGWRAGGEARRGLVFFREWRELYRGDRWIAADEGASSRTSADQGFALRAYRGRIPVCGAHGADSHSAAAPGCGQRHGHALRGADADFCRPRFARRRPGACIADWSPRPGSRTARHSDGRGRSGRTAGRTDSRHALGSERFRTMGYGVLRRIWREPDAVRSFEIVLAVGGAAACRWDISSCCRWRHRTH